MSLSASFSEDLRNEFAKRNLKIGTVIRIFVNDTNPPKEKRLILVGQSYDTLYFATVFINSEINPNVFPTQELRDLNFPLTANNRDYLVHDSFADCSGLAKRPTDWLLKTFGKRIIHPMHFRYHTTVRCQIVVVPNSLWRIYVIPADHC